MKAKPLVLCYFLLFFLTGSLHAQLADVPYSKVQLTDGTLFLGYLVEEKADILVFQRADGSMIELKKEEVRSVSEEKYPMDFQLGNRKPFEMVYDYKPETWYYTLTFGGNLSRNNEEYGIGADAIASFGYQKSSSFGLGIASGVDNLSVLGTAVVYPVLLEVRGYFSEKPITPYYVFRGGYGFSRKSDKLGIVDVKGGFTVRPALGLRIGGRQRGNILLEVGYIMQPHYVEQVFNTSDIRVFTRTFHRLKIAVGIQF